MQENATPAKEPALYRKQPEGGRTPPSSGKSIAYLKNSRLFPTTDRAAVLYRKGRRMDRIIDVADYTAKRYREITGDELDEMKLHKLLYFIQRESLAITNEAAFEGRLEGWKYGPVSPEVRQYFIKGRIAVDTRDISDATKYIVNNVILEYGALASWKLSEISHREISWQRSRKGLSANDIGDREIRLDDIREDAGKVRPYDHIWDMYYDEFEDVPAEELRAEAL